MKIQENVSLAPFTTFGIGGPARYFSEVFSESDLRNAIDYAHSKNLSIFILGGGSNLVVSDQGFSGLVIRIAIHGIDESSDRGRRLFQAGAGEDWDRFVARAID